MRTTRWGSAAAAIHSAPQAQGLRPRSHEYVCEVDVTVRVRIAVSAHSADAAGGEVSDAMVQNAVAELRGGLLADAIQDHDVVDVEEA